jgi:dipeptidyl aminopeptidase/acylaminoacyl peptidase
MQMRMRLATATGCLAGVLVLAACSGTTSPPATPSSSAGAGSGAVPATTSPTSPAAVVTLRTLIAASPEHPVLAVGDRVGTTNGITTSKVSYESGGFTITGLLHVPTGAGPFPAIVAVHGGADPATYASGSELVREQAALAKAGYVVLSTDLRNYADSDDDPQAGQDLNMGSTLDIVNAARALAVSTAPPVDPKRIGLLGHSLGGLEVLSAMTVDPVTAKAVVAIAPASSVVWNNVQRFMKPSDEAYIRVVGAHRTPTENPTFWADVSPATFAARAAAPLLILQGTTDEVVDAAWSPATAKVWSDAGKDVTLVPIQGADHFLDPAWQTGMDQILAFFARQLN